MGYKVKIRKNETQEVKEIHFNLNWYKGGFWWSQNGNMGCDCNRSMSFNDDGSDEGCSDGKYDVVSIILDKDNIDVTGTVKNLNHGDV